MLLHTYAHSVVQSCNMKQKEPAMSNNSDSDPVKIFKLIIVTLCAAAGWEALSWMGAFFGIILGAMLISSIDPDN